MECKECKFALYEYSNLIKVEVKFEEKTINMYMKCPWCGEVSVFTRPLTKTEYFIRKKFEDKKLAKRKKLAKGY